MILVVRFLSICISFMSFNTLVVTQDEVEIEDFCNSEAFQPRCLKNEAILINNATYGRMRIGRCITEEEVKSFDEIMGDDPRKIGCSEDVSDLLHRKCSGKSECEVRSGDFANANIRPCFPMHNLYLEVRYDCISVVDKERSCVISVSKNPIHVISSEDTERKCGTQTQPFVVEAPIGEKINIKLLEFSASSTEELTRESQHYCRSYGMIIDKTGKQNVSICGNRGRREKNVYTSSANNLEIIFDQSKGDTSELLFILKLDAIGCSNLIPPKEAWLKRMDDTIVIGCYTSRQTWQLQCRHGKWIGVIGNCSNGQAFFELDPVPTTRVVANTSNDKQALLIVIIVGATVTFCLAVICTGVVCLRKFYSKGHKYQEYKTLNFPSGGNNLETQQFPPTIADVNNLSASMDTLSKDPVPTYSVYVGQCGISGTNA